MIQTATEDNEEHLTSVMKQELKLFWPSLKVFWLRKDDPTRRNERKEMKRQTDELKRHIKERSWLDFAKTIKIAENMKTEPEGANILPLIEFIIN